MKNVFCGLAVFLISISISTVQLFSVEYTPQKLTFLNDCGMERIGQVTYQKLSRDPYNGDTTLNAEYTFASYTYCMSPEDFDSQKNREYRFLTPAVSTIETPNGTILIDSCDLNKIFSQSVDGDNHYKHLYEFVSRDGLKTFALDYAPAENNTIDTSGYRVHQNYAYIIDLMKPDLYAAIYEGASLDEKQAFIDGNNNTLYEIYYLGKVVGIRYYCAKNNQEYVRFIKPIIQ